MILTQIEPDLRFMKIFHILYFIFQKILNLNRNFKFQI